MNDSGFDRERHARERARSENMIIGLLKLVIVILGILLGSFIGYAVTEFIGPNAAVSLIAFIFGMFFGGLTATMLVNR